MSLILEALRKSEAERLRAQGPGLHAPIPARPVRRVGPAWGPWVAAALGVALLVGTWWVGRPESTPAVEAPPPVEAPAPMIPAETVSADPDPAPLVEPPVEARPDPVVDTPRPTPPVAVAPREPAPVPAMPVAIPIAPPPPAFSEAPPVAEALPGLASLPTTDRAALPPLKVSMHVWAADPARRFAIVDGHRVGEGALLAGGTVVEIRPDGVVLELQGRRVLLARP